MFSSSQGPLSVGDLSRQTPGGSTFGGLAGQQQQPQQQQQQQQPGGLFSFGQAAASQNSFGFGQGAQQQQQPHQQNQQQHQQPGAGQSLFGQQPFQQQQHHQTGQHGPQFHQPGGMTPGQQGFGPGLGSSHGNSSFFGGSFGASSSTAGQAGALGSATTPSTQTEYLPGYLSKLKEARPYSSPLSAERPSRSPPRTRDNEQGAGPSTPFGSERLRSSRGDLGTGPGTSTSPNQRFSSSFFMSSPPGDGQAGAGGAADDAGFGANKSVFGPSGLRSKGRAPSGRHSVAFGRSPSFSRGLRQSRSPPATSATPAPATSLDDDDYAPPIDSLAEDSEMGDTSLSAAPRALTRSEDARAIPSKSADSSALLGVGDTLALRSILVFGFPRALEAAMIEQFSTFGAVQTTDWVALTGASGADGCLEIVYKDAWAALRAIRRNGEVVAGLAMVGVRWKDDGMQREMVVNGLSSPTFSRASSGASPNGATSPSLPSSQSIVSSSATAAAQRAGTPSGGTPRTQIGRPISVLGSKDAVFAASPAGAARGAGSNPLSQLRNAAFGSSSSGPAGNSLFAQQPQTPQNGAAGAKAQQPGSGFLGRINDAVFGW